MVTSIFKKKRRPPHLQIKSFLCFSIKVLFGFPSYWQERGLCISENGTLQNWAGKKSPYQPRVPALNNHQIKPEVHTSTGCENAEKCHPGHTGARRLRVGCGRAAAQRLEGLPRIAAGAGGSRENISLPQRFAWLPARRVEAGLGLPAPGFVGKPKVGLGGCLVPRTSALRRAVWWVSAARSEQLPGPASGGRYEEAASLPEGGGEAPPLEPAALQPRRPGGGDSGTRAGAGHLGLASRVVLCGRSRRFHLPSPCFTSDRERRRGDKAPGVNLGRTCCQLVGGRVFPRSNKI